MKYLFIEHERFYLLLSNFRMYKIVYSSDGWLVSGYNINQFGIMTHEFLGQNLNNGESYPDEMKAKR